MEKTKEDRVLINKYVLIAWEEIHVDAYTEFKESVEALLFNEDWFAEDDIEGNDVEVINDFIRILVSLANNQPTIEEWYTEAIENQNDFAFCICCYIYLDNGAEQIKSGLQKRVEEFKNSGISEGVINFLQQKAEDQKNEIDVPSDKDLNLLTLRRWHYDHPQEYADFLDNVNKAYGGDMTFPSKGFNYLVEMLSLNGIKSMIRLLLRFVPGTEDYRKRMSSSDSSLFHEELDGILKVDLDNDVTRQKILRGNPHFNSTLYWLAFDNGFCKAVDLISEIFLKEENPELIKQLGRELIKSLMRTSFDKAAYTKAQWKDKDKRESKRIVASTLMDLKGRKGRRDICLLLEEMILTQYVNPIIEDVDKIISEWKRFNDSDSILAFIFTALYECELLNEKYSCRIFHNAMLEKFPQYHLKKGYDHAEALFHALTNKGDYNISITADQIEYGRKQTENIRLSFKIIMSPHVIQ